MKTHIHHDHIVSRSKLLAAIIPGVCLAMTGTGLAQTIYFGSGPASGNIALPVVNGVNATVNSQISAGIWNGVGAEYLYQYAVQNTAPAGGPNLDGFNLFTAGPLALGLGGNVANNALSLATGAAGNLMAASALDNQAIGPIGAFISPTPAGTVTPFETPLFQALAPVVGTASGGLGFGVYAFNTPLQAAFGGGGINFDGPLAAGGWEFTAWSDGGGDTLMRWFSSNGVGLAPGASIVFDVFSPFGPVPAGAFPDPPNVDDTFVGVEDAAGDETMAQDTDTSVPEPSTWSLLGASAFGYCVFLRRRFPQV